MDTVGLFNIADLLKLLKNSVKLLYSLAIAKSIID
ncbi:hypothetical protein Bhyg_05220 [Pseudolycoriella hygida]|uniref:Uncharacterized protein n=1 Tax=Pseudolycoriella hygida TaxID=35572 RepID=A0A9Q0NHA3_9DIPT|nr:hypothetical protein Bhyg_05220 [Pseudolycoriella hygida]